jgi:hypothetical protein
MVKKMVFKPVNRIAIKKKLNWHIILLCKQRLRNFINARPRLIFYNLLILICFTIICICPACTDDKKVFESSCDTGINFKRIGFTHLIDSIQAYDQQYVEVVGTYKEAREESALVCDSLFADHSSRHAIWINFSQDCPLYMVGTRKGLFEYNDGKFTLINDKHVIIRGKIDVRHKGHLGSYCATMDRVSYIEL